jgi:hypothetical protein
MLQHEAVKLQVSSVKLHVSTVKHTNHTYTHSNNRLLCGVPTWRTCWGPQPHVLFAQQTAV